MDIQSLITHLSGAKLQSDGHYIALCPCHDDHRPSLDIMRGEKGIVMCCPVCGANGERVMNALGLDVKELFYENKKSAQPFRNGVVTELASVNSEPLGSKRATARDRPYGVDENSKERTDNVLFSVYGRSGPKPYEPVPRDERMCHSEGFSPKNLTDNAERKEYDPSALLGMTRERVTYYYSDELKKVRFYLWDDQKKERKKTFCWYHRGENGRQVKGLPKDENGRSVTPPLYRQGCIAQARENKKTLYIVEGEKDTDTMVNDLGYFAVCSPHGAGRGSLEKKWSTEYNELFKGVSVALIPDNDDPGRELMRYIAAQIKPYADEVKILNLNDEWESLEPKGDITDVYHSEKPIGSMSLEESVRFRLDALTLVTKEYGEKKPDPKSKYICLDDVESTTTEWLWYPYIPRGKITLMTADPGTGKTFLSLYLSAQVSTGRPFYGEDKAYSEPENVVYQTAEDGIADTIKPRLEAMRPDFSKIFILDETNKTLSLSDKRVEEIMIDLSPKLMIFDPLQAYLGSKIDMNRANEVRPVLQKLHLLAEKYNTAVILIMHHSKASQNSALHRALGSMDIPAVARSMLILGRDPKNPFGRILCHEKSSLAKTGRSICFEVNPMEGGIKFNGFSDLSADDILNAKSTERTRQSVKKDELCDKILEMFGEEDTIEIEDMKAFIERLDCSQSTLLRARKSLGIKSEYKGYGKDKTVIWKLTDD